ncbi:MFS transporter [Brevundimonas sp. BAL450]|nr:MFS transporter [Brevundimonas sp. BAL450]MBG7614722.1 MFS transporter [Brevundimonas sp. BAL450]
MFRFDPTFRSEFRENWGVLVIAFCCLFFGFSAPAFALPFLFTEVINEFGWTREQATLLASAKYLTGAAAALVVGRFVDVIGERSALIVTLSLGGLALLSFLWVPNLTAYYLSGMLLGLAGPGAMVAVKVLVSRNFDTSQGTATGFALLGTSIGSVIVPLVITFLIAAFGWRYAFGLLSLGVWGLTLPLLIFFFPRAARQRHADQKNQPAAERPRIGLGEVARLARRKPFWLLAGALFLAAASDQAFIQHQVLMLNDIHMSREMAAMAISAIGMLGIVCRVAIGNLLDSRSNKAASALYITLTATSLLAFYLVNPVLLIAFVVLRAVGHAVVLLDTTVITKHVFGLKNFGTLIGVYTAIVSLGYAAGPWLMGRLYDMAGNYSTAFIVFAVLPLIAAALMWSLKPAYWLALNQPSPAGKASGAIE